MKTALDAVVRPKGTEEQLGVLRPLLDNPDVLRVVLDKSRPFFLVERRSLHEEEALSTEQALHDAVRQSPMEEYTAEGGKSAAAQMLDFFEAIGSEGLEVSHLLAGSKKAFESWLGVRLPRLQIPRVFGVRVYFLTQLPDDVVLACGSLAKESMPGEIKFSIKGTIG